MINIKEIVLPLIWLGIAIFAFIVEACTVSLVSVWFGAAALVSCILAAFKVPLVVQIIVFAVLSIGLFVASAIIFRQKKQNSKNTDTPDEFANEVVVVTKEIKPGELGEVKTRYEKFNALGDNPKDTYIEGEKAIIVEVSGNKLIVKKYNK